MSERNFLKFYLYHGDFFLRKRGEGQKKVSWDKEGSIKCKISFPGIGSVIIDA